LACYATLNENGARSQISIDKMKIFEDSTIADGFSCQTWKVALRVSLLYIFAP
jgi:hypothetical protein